MSTAVGEKKTVFFKRTKKSQKKGFSKFNVRAFVSRRGVAVLAFSAFFVVIAEHAKAD